MTAPHYSAEQIHSSFNKLMSELKKPGAPYVLSLANRLYGEQSYQFVEVRLKEIMQGSGTVLNSNRSVRAKFNKLPLQISFYIVHIFSEDRQT